MPRKLKLNLKRKNKKNKSLDGLVFPMRPSPKDDRDYIVERLFVNNRSIIGHLHPDNLDLRPYLPEPRNQGSRGTCAAFTAACIKEYHERKDVNYKNYMSPNSIYFYRENKDSEGMYARNVMQILQKIGICPENYFPYTKTEPDVIPEMAQLVMKNFTIRHYAQVETIEGAKEAIHRYGPLLICVPVYDNFPTIWKPKNSGDEMKGGHAMAIVGYNSEGFIIRNSWGCKWNGDGHVIFPYSDWGAQWEIWSSVDEESPNLPPDLVDPAKPHSCKHKLLAKLFPCLFRKSDQ